MELSGPLLEAASALLAARHGKNEAMGRGEGAMLAGVKRPRNQPLSEAAAMQRQYGTMTRGAGASTWNAMYSTGEVQPLPLEACGDIEVSRQQSLPRPQQHIQRMQPPPQQAQLRQHWPSQMQHLNNFQHTTHHQQTRLSDHTLQTRDATLNQFPNQQQPPPQNIYKRQSHQDNAHTSRQVQYGDRQSVHISEQHQQHQQQHQHHQHHQHHQQHQQHQQQHQQHHPKQKRQNSSKRKSASSTKAGKQKSAEMMQRVQQQPDDSLIRRTSVILPGRSIVPPPYQRKPNLIEADPRLVAVPPVRTSQDVWRPPFREKTLGGLGSGSSFGYRQGFDAQSLQAPQYRDFQLPEGIQMGFQGTQYTQVLQRDPSLEKSHARPRHRVDGAPVHHLRDRHDRIQGPQPESIPFQPDPPTRANKFGDGLWSNEEHVSRAAQAVNPNFPSIVTTTTLQYSRPGEVQVFSALPSLHFRSNGNANNLSSILNPLTTSSAEEEGEDSVDGSPPHIPQNDGLVRETVSLVTIGSDHTERVAESSAPSSSSHLTVASKSGKPLSKNRLRKLEKKSKRQERKRSSLSKKSTTVIQSESSTPEYPAAAQPAKTPTHLTPPNKPTALSDAPRTTTKKPRTTKSQKRKQEVETPKVDSYPGDQLKRQQEQMFRQARVAMLAKQQRPGHVEVNVFTRPLPIIAPRITVTPDTSQHMDARELKRARIRSVTFREVRNAEEPKLAPNGISTDLETHQPLSSRQELAFLSHFVQRRADTDTRALRLNHILDNNLLPTTPHSIEEQQASHALPMPSAMEHKLLLAAASHYSEKAISDQNPVEQLHEETNKNTLIATRQKKGKPRKQRDTKASTVSSTCDKEPTSLPEATSSDLVQNQVLPTSSAVLRPQPETVMIFCKRDFLRFQAGRLWRKYQEIKRKRDQANASVTGRRARYLNSRYQSGSQTKPSTDLEPSQQASNKRARLPTAFPDRATDCEVVEIFDDDDTAEEREPEIPPPCHPSPALTHVSISSESNVSPVVGDSNDATEPANVDGTEPAQELTSSPSQNENVHTTAQMRSSDVSCLQVNVGDDELEHETDPVAPQEEASLDSFDCMDAQDIRTCESLSTANSSGEHVSEYDSIISATLEDILSKIEASLHSPVDIDVSHDKQSTPRCVIGAVDIVNARARQKHSCNPCDDQPIIHCEDPECSTGIETNGEINNADGDKDDLTPCDSSSNGVDAILWSPQRTTGNNDLALPSVSAESATDESTTTSCEEETFVIIEEDTFGYWPETPIQTTAEGMTDSEVTPDESDLCAIVCDDEDGNNPNADSDSDGRPHVHKDDLQNDAVSVPTAMGLDNNLVMFQHATSVAIQRFKPVEEALI